MTDEELIEGLRAIPYCSHGLGLPCVAAERLRELLVRYRELTGQSAPPLPGSIAVRIAVAASNYGYTAAQEIDKEFSEERALKMVRDAIGEMDEIAAEAIITAHIPPRVVPEVTATVEPFDPEATDA